MLTAAPWLHPQRSWRIAEKTHISSSQTVDCFGEFTLLQKMITGQLLWKLKDLFNLFKCCIPLQVRGIS